MLIDPIAVNLHHARTTREVVFTRLDSAQVRLTPLSIPLSHAHVSRRLQASFEDFLFKKELWTSVLIARHLPWHEASFWLEDAVAHSPTLIAVGMLDSVVNPRAASQGFGSWKVRAHTFAP